MDVIQEYPTSRSTQTSKNDLILFSEDIIKRSLKLLFSFGASKDSIVTLFYDSTTSDSIFKES